MGAVRGAGIERPAQRQTNVRSSIWILLLAISVAGCSAKYRVDSIEKPSAKLSPDTGFYVILPADGSFEEQTYEQSGTYVAEAIRVALLKHVRKAVIGSARGGNLSSAMDHAKQAGLAYVFQPTILHWEDRATEWSGITDKITLKYQVIDVRSGSELSSTTARASSKWGTFGGDHPQDLLPEPTKHFVDQLF